MGQLHQADEQVFHGVLESLLALEKQRELQCEAKRRHAISDLISLRGHHRLL
jgi:hypothetical protein